MVQKVFGICEAKNGAEADELCCRLEKMGTKEFSKMMKRTQTLEDGGVPAKEAKNCRIEGQKKRITRKEYQRLTNKFEMEGLMAQ